MLLVIIINIIVISLGVLGLDILNEKDTKALNDFCKVECK